MPTDTTLSHHAAATAQLELNSLASLHGWERESWVSFGGLEASSFRRAGAEVYVQWQRDGEVYTARRFIRKASAPQENWAVEVSRCRDELAQWLRGGGGK